MPHSACGFIRDILHERARLKLEIRAGREKAIGHLSPVTVSALENDELLRKLTQWRNQANRYFLTQFTATPERTRRWLAEAVLKDDSRLLFLLYARDKLIGQYGFKDLSAESVEVDNLLRGEMGGHPRLIHWADATLVQWLIQTFQVKRLYGFLLADNLMALNLHRGVGFLPVATLPLQKREVDGELHLTMGRPRERSPDGLYCHRIELIASEFRWPEDE